MSEVKVITVGWLKKCLEHARSDEDEVKVLLALPSIGPRAYTRVTYASFGFDWDRGLLFSTEKPLVPKEKKQDIYEAAHDFLMWKATESYTKKRDTYEHREAKRILIQSGVTEEELRKYTSLFHRDVPVLR